jgi:hypothetical protein
MLKYKEGITRGINVMVIPALFLAGVWLVVFRSLGPQLNQLPGDLVDTRFNIYILEHGFRWISALDQSFWDAPFFYPYPLALAFSDNHLGSLLFYSAFRVFNLDRETAFQGWYILGYCLNFLSTAWVLKRLKLAPLAVGAGAFLFAFGLPVLAQESHQQLLYRFCIPPACYAFWQFIQKPGLKQIASGLFWVFWQYAISIYLGVFLCLLLVAASLILPFYAKVPLRRQPAYWWNMFAQAWKSSKLAVRSFYILSVLCLGALLIMLLKPYATASQAYGIYRSWSEVSELLPRLQSFFIADASQIWQSLASLTAGTVSQRQEQQLFVGGAVIGLLVLGLVWRFQSPRKKIAALFLWALGLLILLTICVDRFSLFIFLWILPGFNSIRAVSRIILVLMWPLALYSAVVIDACLAAKKKILTLGITLLVVFLVAESVFYTHYTTSKASAQARIIALQEHIPSNIPQDPVLFVMNSREENWYLTEVDAMLLSQDLGWPVMNGYSAFIPPGYGPSTDPGQVIARLEAYMQFSNLIDPLYLNDLPGRVVLLDSVE